MIEPLVIAFTKDWQDVPTCTTHVLREMARSMNVLWVNSIGMRRPSAAHAGDLRRVLRRLASAFETASRKENGLHVLSPLLIPKAQSKGAVALNRALMCAYVKREKRRLRAAGDCGIEYWCFVPTAVDLLPQRAGNESLAKAQSTQSGHDRGNERVVYYCVDDWSKFTNLDTEWVSAKERQMLARADVVFTPARFLVKKCSEFARGPVIHVPHGVEHAKFRRAVENAVSVPADMAGMPGPVIGFYGNIYPWIDFKLIGAIARRRPEWTFVMLGQEYCDVSELKALANVRFIGRREHDELPAYCRAFNAAMIPYDMSDPRMTSVNPVKLKELLAAGVPVVTCALPEVVEELASSAAEPFRHNIRIARNENEWMECLDAQIRRTDRQQISDSVAGEDWSAKVATIRRKIISETRQTC